MRTKILGLIALIAVLTLVPTSAAQAAWPHERDGVLLGFGLGAGTAGVNILDIDSDRDSGLGGSFRLGYAFTPQVAAGLEGTFWTKEADGDTWTFNVTTAALTFYPGATGFFVRGGVGVASVEFETDVPGGTFTASDDGFGFLLGAGYEWRLTRKFALGPAVDYNYGKVSDDMSLNYVNFTLGATWYF